MLSGLRTILLSTELNYPPIPSLAIAPERVRELYNQLREPGGYPYENLELQGVPHPTMTTKRPPEGCSTCRIGGGKVFIEEDSLSHGMTLDDFIVAVKTIVQRLNYAGPFIFQKCRVTCTAQPSNHEDAVDMLADRVANVYKRIGEFGRPPSLFGVRFRFYPAVEQPEQLADESVPAAGRRRGKKKPEPVVHRGMIQLRFESYSKDVKQVWMEAEANFVEDVIEPGNLELIEKNIRDTYTFVTGNAVKFLNQFDTKQDQAGES